MKAEGNQNSNQTTGNKTGSTKTTSSAGSKASARGSANGADENSSVSEILSGVTELGKTFITNMSGSREKVMESTADAVHSVEDSVRKSPWTYIGGALAVGFAIGYLVTRKSGTAVIAAGAKELKNKIEENINKVSEHLQ